MFTLHPPEPLGQAAFNQKMGGTRASWTPEHWDCASDLALLLLVCLDVPLALASGLLSGPAGVAETAHYNGVPHWSTEMHFLGVTPDLSAGEGEETVTSTKRSGGHPSFSVGLQLLAALCAFGTGPQRAKLLQAFLNPVTKPDSSLLHLHKGLVFQCPRLGAGCEGAKCSLRPSARLALCL